MSYINTARKSRLTINGVDESSRMISWTVNDDSVFKNGIMRTSGTVVLGTTNLSQYDYRRTAYKRGQIVLMEIWNSDLSQYEVHPRGFLYVLSTSFDASSQQVSIEVGCQLAAWTLSDNVDEVYSAAGVQLDGAQKTIQNISQALYSQNELIYQDNTGTIVKKQAVSLTAPTDPASVPSSWSTGSQTEAVSSTALQSSDEIADIVTLNYNAVTAIGATDGENTKVTTDTSNYDILFEALTWVREGSGDEVSGTIAIDDSFDGSPGAAIGDYQSVSDFIKVNTSRTETTTEVYGGPGGQVTSKTQEVYQPGTEVNEEYFKDKYSACRYTCSIDGDADCVGCSYLQATSPMLSSRIITTYTYDSAGTVIQERVERWLPVLAAAQPFNWRTEGDDGQPVSFQEVSLTDLYRDTIVITDYSQVDGKNIEQITTYRSAAVEYNAGIYATQESIGGSELALGPVTSAPVLLNEAQVGLATTAVTGTGTGMTVSAAWPAAAGQIQSLTVTSSLSDCQYALKPEAGYIIGSTTASYFDGPFWTLVGGSGWINGESIDITTGAQGNGFSGKIDIYYQESGSNQYIRFYPDLGSFNGPGYTTGQSITFRGLSSGNTWTTTISSDSTFDSHGPSLPFSESGAIMGQREYSAGLWWQALPQSGGTNNGAWTGGSGSGFVGHVKDSALPNLQISRNGSDGFYSTAPLWTCSVTSTDFVGSATDILQIEATGTNYEVGDVLTWSQSFSTSDQFGSDLSGLTRAVAGSFGQQLNTTTITAQVTAVGQGFPSLTVVDPGSGYLPGDQIKITAATLTAAVGYTVTDDVLFTVLTTEGGAPNLGEGIASLSLTNYTPPTAGGQTAWALAGTGTSTTELLFEQTYGPTTSVTNTGTGAAAAVNVTQYNSYVPYTAAEAPRFEISALATHGSGGGLFLDNPYMTFDLPAMGNATSWCFEGWFYIEDFGESGATLFGVNQDSWPSIPTAKPNSSYSGSNVAVMPWIHAVINSNGEKVLIGGKVDFTGTGNNTGNFFALGSVTSTPCPMQEWFHVAYTMETSGTTHIFRWYLNGAFIGLSSYSSSFTFNWSSSDKVFMGCGQWDRTGTYVNDWIGTYSPTSNADYVRMAVDQVRFVSGDYVYNTPFTPVSLERTAPTNSLVSGIYENVPLTTVTGNGKAGSVNLEVITDGGAVIAGTTLTPVTVTPAIAYTESIGVVETSGGSGTGLRLELGLGYSGTTYTTKTPVVVRSVVDPGKDYEIGDRVKITSAQIYKALSNSGFAGTINGDIVSPISIDYSENGGAWMFPNVVGTQYAVGNTVELTVDAVRGTGAGNPPAAIQATVTAITPARDLQNLTLDAIDGGKRVVINTSSDSSNLSDAPSTNATPQLPTSEFTTSLTLRTDAYAASAGFKPDTSEETLQVPTQVTNASQTVEFVEDYKVYLKSFTLGEAYGMRVGETLRDEIMSSWEPMVGLRYTDERIGQTFAMRADAATWGVDSNEAAVVYNGLWFGDVSYNGETEILLDIGTVPVVTMGLSFDTTTTFDFGSPVPGTTDFPLRVDWENTAITELVRSEPANLLTNTESMSAANGYTIYTLTATLNDGTAPDGTNTAGKYLENTASNAEHTLHSPPRAFTTATLSVFVKGIGRNAVTARMYHNINDWITAVYDLTANGAVVSTNAGSASLFTGVSAGIENYGNGWYRIWFTATQPSRNCYPVLCTGCTSTTPTLEANNGAPLYTGDVTKGYYLWGGQFEEASAVSEYQPVGDYSLGNMIANPYDISFAGGFTNSFMSSAVNVIPGPDGGAVTADRWLEQAATNEHSVYPLSAQAVPPTSIQSVYVQAIGRQYAGLRYYFGANDHAHVTFDLVNETVTDIQYGSSSLFTGISAGIENAGNGWYLIWATVTQPERSSYSWVFNGVTTATPTLNGSGSEVYLGDVTKGYYLWGARLEEGSTPPGAISHSYAAGAYTLGVFYDSADVGSTFCPHPGGYDSASSVTSVNFSSSYVAPVNMFQAFFGCDALTSMVAVSGSDFSATTGWNQAFKGCSSLTTWSGLTYSSSTAMDLEECWMNCSSLVDFPAGQFDSIQGWSSATTSGLNAFDGCALSATSIENILVSLDICPAGPTVFDVDGGTNASWTLWSTTAKAALTSLQGKGWTINYNGQDATASGATLLSSGTLAAGAASA